MATKEVKVTEWPTVLPNDEGIRPAGKQDRCFYCHNKIGELHGIECVTVEKKVKYEVYLQERPENNSPEKLVGHFTRNDPFFWSSYDCDFHKNESSWCASNAVDDIEWIDPKFEEELAANVKKFGYNCECSFLRFEYDETVDEGPFITIEVADEN